MEVFHIWRAIKRDALLEDVIVNEYGEVDYCDHSIIENSRVSYPIYPISKIVLPSKAGHANKIIYLSADVFLGFYLQFPFQMRSGPIPFFMWINFKISWDRERNYRTDSVVFTRFWRSIFNLTSYANAYP